MFRYAFLLTISLFMFGCASNPPQQDLRHDFSLIPDNAHGRLVIQPFQIPVTEPAVTFLHFLGAINGAKMDTPYWANIYDVTDAEIRPLGGFKYEDYSFLFDRERNEQLLPVGRRILMVDRSSAIEPDFLEIDIRPNENTFVGIGRSGLLMSAFAVELKVRKEDYEFCYGLRVPVNERDGKKSEMYPTSKNKTELIDDYMKSRGIDSEAQLFKKFCLSQTEPVYVNEANVLEFENKKPDIVAMRNKYLEKWLASNDKKTPFDIMQGIQKLPKTEINAINAE